jgi:glycosyltransferase involved in cell wall biosynthesis
MVDGYISLSKAGRETIVCRYPVTKGLPYAVIPHGHYRDAYPRASDRLEARQRVGIPPNRKVFLFFGTIARYKGLPDLVKAFRSLEDREAVLCIAGAVADKNIELFLRAESSVDSRIYLQLSRVPARAVELYFKASDVVVLPFSDIFNSGSALLALSFDRPLLVPALGAMPELQQMVGDEWVRTYEGSLTADYLKEVMEWALNGERQERAPLDQFNWDRLAADTLNLFTALLTREKVGTVNLSESNNIPDRLNKTGNEMDEPLVRQTQR